MGVQNHSRVPSRERENLWAYLFGLAGGPDLLRTFVVGESSARDIFFLSEFTIIEVLYKEYITTDSQVLRFRLNFM